MSLLKKYSYFKAGITMQNTNYLMQKFFKTNPTEKQILILDDMIEREKNLWLCVVLLYLFLGIVLGALITNTYFL